MRRTFTVHYKNGNARTGTLYAQGNIMMDDGELYARLDQLVTDSVSYIDFAGGFTKQGLAALRDLLKKYPPGYERDRMVYGKWVPAPGEEETES